MASMKITITAIAAAFLPATVGVSIQRYRFQDMN
jgi:hypothetical protein